jgi:hypothetical protein
MTKSKIALAVSAIVWSCAAAAQPQPTERTPAPGNTVYIANTAVTPFVGQVDMLRGEGAVLGGVVKDKPFSASSITESAQVLADGNRIVNRNESKIFRDSQGRTRREQTLGALGVWRTANEPVTIITINDPVADASFVLDPARRTARKTKPIRLALGGGMAWAPALPALPVPPPPGAGVTDAGARVVLRENTDILVARAADPNAPPAPDPFELPLPPPGANGGPGAVRGTFGTAGVAVGAGPGMAAFSVSAFGFAGGEPRVEDLGDQVLEGVLAHGTRTVHTIPAGAIGNDRPIEIVAEEWFSKDIDAVVLRKNSDPRFGETTYRLVGLVRGEPAPELFAVPQGYEVEDVAFAAPRRIELRSIGDEAPDASTAPAPGARIQRGVFLAPPEPAK